ncbi:MAG: dihydrodipicolinate synthase family protein, partial [Hungatella sp.]
AKFSRPWTDMTIMEECRENYFKYFPLLQALYGFSNPIVIKAALTILGLPGGPLRKPYQSLMGQKLIDLETLMGEMGVIDKYSVK